MAPQPTREIRQRIFQSWIQQKLTLLHIVEDKQRETTHAKVGEWRERSEGKTKFEILVVARALNI